MNANTLFQTFRTLLFAIGLLGSAVCFAHGGWNGGGWHGGGWHGGGWHGGGWHGGYYHGGWGGWGPGVVIGVPSDNYYAPACQTIRVCNSYGHCWYQDSCY